MPRFVTKTMHAYIDYPVAAGFLCNTRVHLSVDFMVGVVFVLAPHLLGFSGLDLWYYTVLGATVLAVVGLHKSETPMLAAA